MIDEQAVPVQMRPLCLPQLEAPEFAPGDVPRIAEFIRRRVSYELQGGQHDSREHIFPELQRRIYNAGQGRDWTGRTAVFRTADLPAYRAELEADLREMATMSTDRLRRCVTTPSPFAHGRGIHAIEMVAAPPSAALPRIQPAELVAWLAARGILVEASDGNLLVRPAELLTDADRDVLRTNKAGLLEALSAPAVVI